VATVRNISEAEGLLHRDADGVLRENIGNHRVFIFSCSAYRSMCEALYDQFQSGAGIILYRMGEGYGKKLVKGVPQLGLSSEEMIEAFSKLSHLAGWGKIMINFIPGKDSEAIVEGSPFLLWKKDIGPTSCFFMSGVLAGAASELLDGEYKVQEIKCASEDDTKVCKFKIVQKLQSEP
jgi:predicted hydrocarbon binding protein